MIHSFFIFDRHCNCIYSREYTNGDAINKTNDSDTAKLLFGILYSLKNISGKLAHTNDDSGFAPSNNTLKSFTLGTYRAHYLESMTGLKFILVSDTHIDNLQPVLWELYSTHYLKNVVHNGLSPVEFLAENDPYSKISNHNFIVQSDAYIQSLPVYR
ncbi:snare-like protein [Suhomyces tanzawaensis NRRL Y-17324]|uniref:Trafficking protein particle complex subunit n=1 Tax=Suhomyces tanzawaensis NRRL Y-17324 TaxID=984487 RepID=A0A1E4SM62_9ASCO|nr:snare-like protein [Suhomyces tanzawaensis NRRL Y-17324]ODV80472.1 snare-like protein [Suhomyces tanzawaensis NRRL Y-17324]